MGIAQLMSLRSTCYRRSVGAVLVTADNNILSVAYNGPPKGAPHCGGLQCTEEGICTRSIHAEVNVIERAPLHDGPLTMYVTESPCPDCAWRILRCPNIHAVYYTHEYRDRTGIQILLNNKSKIKVYAMTAAGLVKDVATQEMVHDPPPS